MNRFRKATIVAVATLMAAFGSITTAVQATVHVTLDQEKTLVKTEGLVTGDTLFVTAGSASGQNDISVAQLSAGVFTVQDTLAGVQTGSENCQVAPGGTIATCVAANVIHVRVDAKNDDDEVSVSVAGVDMSPVDATIIGGPGADELKGSAQKDTIYGDNENGTGDLGVSNEDVINSASNDDQIFGGVDNDTLRAGSGIDQIKGNAGDDTTLGEAGNDTIIAGAADDGNDSVSGGFGTDTADYSVRTEAVEIDLDGVADDGSGTETDNVQGDVENVIGGSGGDTITAGATAVNNSFQGGEGDDDLDGKGGNDTLYGQPGLDTLKGGPGTDTLYGANGNCATTGTPPLSGVSACNTNDDLVGDVLFGGAGGDTVYGEGGSDSMYGGDGTCAVDGLGETPGGTVCTNVDAAGNDTLKGGHGDDIVHGEFGDDTLFGEAGKDYLGGDDGNDFCEGGPGVDVEDGTCETSTA